MSHRVSLALSSTTFSPLPGQTLLRAPDGVCQIALTRGDEAITTTASAPFSMNARMKVKVQVPEPIKADGVVVYRDGTIFMRRSFWPVDFTPFKEVELDWLVLP